MEQKPKKGILKDDENIIKKIYSENIHREWNRLIKSPFHKLEFETTLHFLEKYLPKKGLILDAGGGPGRYTVELAKKDYNVVLLDLTPQNLEFAKKQLKKAKVQNSVKDIIEGSIVDLSKIKNNYFDAVLCLGSSLSHVRNEKQRARAISELKRVAKKNAPIFISVMGKFGHLVRGVNKIESARNYFELSLEGNDKFWGGKGYFHYFTFEELKNLVEKKVRILECVGLEGIGGASEESINKLYKNSLAWKNWRKMHYALCTHPTIVDMSIHFMIIGKKK